MNVSKTSDLTDVALDLAVAKALGLAYRFDDKYGPMCFRPQTVKGEVSWDSKPLPYSSDWAHGGPIIDTLKGLILKQWLESNLDTCCQAEIHNYDGDWIRFGPTTLIAAMRCFVASRLGDEVDVGLTQVIAQAE